MNEAIGKFGYDRPFMVTQFEIWKEYRRCRLLIP